MSLAIDIASDWQFIDGIETVSVTPQSPPANAVTGVKALRRDLSRTDRLANAGIEPDDTVFHVWVATMGVATDLQRGWLITQADGKVWTVQTASLETLGTRWRCVCRKRV